MQAKGERERFATRLGFILISAGCAIGLGNIWRFPYVAGKYGGGAFVLFYLVFLVLLGLPILVMEFAVGRASQRSAADSFRRLEPKGSKWHFMSVPAVAGNYLLMMFYTTVGGWMLSYVVKMLRGEFEVGSPQLTEEVFDRLLRSPSQMVFWMLLTVCLCFFTCSFGLQKGVERVTKVMMSCLLGLLLVLCIRSLTLPGAAQGVAFYLLPDFGRLTSNGLANTLFAAMGQAFFTLSVGIGSMAVFGSYIGRERTLLGESIHICALDTAVALLGGLIFFPACFALGIDPGEGPGLVFVTLPGVFQNMPGGRFFGALFFLFLSFAALSTIVAVFENLIRFWIDRFGWSRRRSVVVNLLLVSFLSLPCALGYNLLSFIQPMGPGSTIQDLEDFLVSNNLLPLGSLGYLLFCTARSGWGWEGFLNEANTGRGILFPRWARIYVSHLLPILILVLLIAGYWQRFFA